MRSLEAIVSHVGIKLNEMYNEMKDEMRKMLRENKASIVIGVGYGVASRVLFASPSALLLPAALTPIAFTNEKLSKLFRHVDKGGCAVLGYGAGYVLADVVLRAFFPDSAAPQPLQPYDPVNPPNELPTIPHQGIIV